MKTKTAYRLDMTVAALNMGLQFWSIYEGYFGLPIVHAVLALILLGSAYRGQKIMRIEKLWISHSHE